MMSAPSLDSPKAHAAHGEDRSESRDLVTVSAAPESGPAARGARPVVPASVACIEYAADTVIAQKYRLVRVLCQGGMGAVWLAHNELLDMPVALKLIRHDLRTPGLAERLMTEARLAARLEHPAVVSVFDVGNTDHGDPYIVMELLKGEDLREQLEREARLEPLRSVQLLLPILEGLVAAHARGIVHRDLKPENVYFTHIEERIQPKIVDFGIAKPTTGEKQRCVTRSGAVVGSPDYMSPEQARGLDDVDHRADIWAFAVVLYECVTGRPPFADSSYEALLRDVVEKSVVPITERGIDEPELSAILTRGLSKNRDERWQTAREMGVALAQWLRARGVEEDVCGRSLRTTWLRASDPPRDAMGSAPILLVPRSPRVPRVSPAPISCTAPTAESVPDYALSPPVATPLPATPVPETLPSRRWAAKGALVTTLPRWTTRKLVGIVAIGTALVAWALVGTLLTGVGTASASAPAEVLELGLGEPVQARARAAVDLLSSEARATGDENTIVDADIPVLDLTTPRSAHRRAAGFVRATPPLREMSPPQTAQSTSTAPASAPERKASRRWAPFVEQDLGF